MMTTKKTERLERSFSRSLLTSFLPSPCYLASQPWRAHFKFPEHSSGRRLPGALNSSETICFFPRRPAGPGSGSFLFLRPEKGTTESQAMQGLVVVGEHIQKTLPKTAPRTPRYHPLTSPQSLEVVVFVSGVNFGYEGAPIIVDTLSIRVLYHYISSNVRTYHYQHTSRRLHRWEKKKDVNLSV